MVFACNKYLFVEVELSDNEDIIIESERKILVEHAAKLMKNATDYKGGFALKPMILGVDI